MPSFVQTRTFQTMEDENVECNVGVGEEASAKEPLLQEPRFDDPGDEENVSGKIKTLFSNNPDVIDGVVVTDRVHNMYRSYIMASSAAAYVIMITTFFEVYGFSGNYPVAWFMALQGYSTVSVGTLFYLAFRHLVSRKQTRERHVQSFVKEVASAAKGNASSARNALGLLARVDNDAIAITADLAELSLVLLKDPNASKVVELEKKQRYRSCYVFRVLHAAVVVMWFLISWMLPGTWIALPILCLFVANLYREATNLSNEEKEIQSIVDELLLIASSHADTRITIV